MVFVTYLLTYLQQKQMKPSHLLSAGWHQLISVRSNVVQWGWAVDTPGRTKLGPSCLSE